MVNVALFIVVAGLSLMIWYAGVEYGRNMERAEAQIRTYLDSLRDEEKERLFSAVNEYVGILCEPNIVDIDRLAQAENDIGPTAVSRKGACGPCQFMPATWDAAVKEMGLSYGRRDMWNQEKSKMVAAYVINGTTSPSKVCIPHQLRSFGFPVTVRNKLIWWNMGIGKLAMLKDKWHSRWQEHLPTEMLALIERYEAAKVSK